MWSRNASSTVTRGSRLSLCVAPLTVSLTADVGSTDREGTVCAARGGSAEAAASAAPPVIISRRVIGGMGRYLQRSELFPTSSVLGVRSQTSPTLRSGNRNPVLLHSGP